MKFFNGESLYILEDSKYGNKNQIGVVKSVDGVSYFVRNEDNVAIVINESDIGCLDRLEQINS